MGRQEQASQSQSQGSSSPSGEEERRTVKPQPIGEEGKQKVTCPRCNAETIIDEGNLHPTCSACGLEMDLVSPRG